MEGHLETDAQTFSDWGVDYIKVDGCYSDIETLQEGTVPVRHSVVTKPIVALRISFVNQIIDQNLIICNGNSKIDHALLFISLCLRSFVPENKRK